MVETDRSRRSDRWEASGPPKNPWAWASLAFALLGLGAAGLIAAATAGAGILGSAPDQVGYALYGAVPSFGVLAVSTGFAGRHRGQRRWLAWIGILVGSLLVVVALAAVMILVNALRTLG